MAPNIYITSIALIVSLGGLGYGLMKLTAPSADKIERIKKSTSQHQISNSEEQKALFLKRLKEATTERPTFQVPSIKKE